MKYETITEQDNKQTKKNDTHINSHSPLYMILFYLVAIITMASMGFHYLSLRSLYIDVFSVTNETVANINFGIPYENLIIALILYCLGTFGFEGTRSIIMSLDLSEIKAHAQNMPRYKRNRLIQMLFTFIIMTIVAMIFQLHCIRHKITNADFHLNYLTAGIGVFMALLAYADFGPKLSKSIGDLVAHAKKVSPKTEEELKKEQEDIKEEAKKEEPSTENIEKDR